MYHPPQAEPVKIVQLTSADVQAATHLLRLLGGISFDHAKELGTVDLGKHPLLADDLSSESDDLIARARRIYEERRRRSKLFNRAMFGEPAWDMLLGLYITDTGTRHTVGGVIQFTDAPATTALRWVEYLEQQKLIARQPHPTDRRSAFVALTDKARDLLNGYLKEAPAV